MTALNRKLFRDLLHMKGQAVAISLVIASGVAVFVMAVSTLQFLKATQSTYNERARFAHVFANCTRAPNTLTERLREVPGVSSVETRISKDVSLDVEGLDEPAIGRLISIPDRGPQLLNLLHLRSGRMAEPGKGDEAVVSEAFCDSNGLGIGDTVTAVLNGTQEKIRIVGIGLSPEYIFGMRPGAIVPDDRRFGVFWMSESALAAAFDLEGAFNSVTATLLHGGSEAIVIEQIDHLLKPYGGVGAYGRADQTSYRFLSDEIKQLRAMALVAPSIFLSVAAFLLHVVLSRQISLQREQIAALKAFGYTKWEVGLHYLKLAMLVSAVGSVIGTALGTWLATGISTIYADFYRFPTFHYSFDWEVALWGCGVTMLAVVFGTLHAVLKAVTLPPAEAMRPEPPPVFQRTILERLGVERFFPQSARMILRELERKPIKSLLSSLGIACSVSVMILGNFGVDAIGYLIEFQFFIAQRHDVNVIFIEATNTSVEFDLKHLPGVMNVESYRGVPIKLRSGHIVRRTTIMGLGPERDLYRLLDANEIPARVPPNGLILSDMLGRVLEVEPGDYVTVEVLDGERGVYEVPVTGFVKEFAGTNAYMDKMALHRLLEEPVVSNGAFLMVDPAREQELYDFLKETPRVAGVSVRAAAVEGFQKTIAENQLKMQSFNIMFACVIAFGMVYNTARISLAERSRELATLRVIGFTRGEVSMILLGELALLAVIAIPLGYAIGYGFCLLMVLGFNSEMYRIPLIVSPANMAFAAMITLIASLISGLVVRRKIDELDLVGVLKARD